MIPDFPHNIRIRLAQLKKNVASWRCSVSALLAVSVLYYEESLVSSNLNSELLRFHCAHSNLHPIIVEFELNLIVQLNFWSQFLYRRFPIPHLSFMVISTCFHFLQMHLSEKMIFHLEMVILHKNMKILYSKVFVQVGHENTYASTYWK